MQARGPNNLRGIDVSRWQGTIDWQKVKTAGIHFAFIKASEGNNWMDPQLRRNATAAHAVGIKVGFYHFAHPDNNPMDEVNHFLSSTKGLPYDLPPVLDLEQNKGLTKTQVTNFALQFLAELERRVGQKPLVYTYTHFAQTYCGKELKEWPLWIAHYGVEQPRRNGVWDQWSVFQYTDKGTVNGIRGNVDLNVMEGSFMEEQTKADKVVSTWAKDAWNWAVTQGITDGQDPKKVLTSEQMVTMLYRYHLKQNRK